MWYFSGDISSGIHAFPTKCQMRFSKSNGTHNEEITAATCLPYMSANIPYLAVTTPSWAISPDRMRIPKLIRHSDVTITSI